MNNQLKNITKINSVQAFYLLNEYYQRNSINSGNHFGEIVKSVIKGNTTYIINEGRVIGIKGEYFTTHQGSLPIKSLTQVSPRKESL